MDMLEAAIKLAGVTALSPNFFKATQLI